MAALQHMLMQTACPVFRYLKPGLQNVKMLRATSEIVTTLTSQMIQKETRVDPVLSQVYSFIIGGWPTVVMDPSFAPFKSKRDELTTQQGCI